MTAEQLKQLETNLWEAATTLRNSSGLSSNEYSTSILGVVFLRYAETMYAPHADAIKAEFDARKGKRNEIEIEKIAISKCGFYLPDHARYDFLLTGQFKANGKTTREALQQAMRDIERFNDLADTLPINEYEKLTSENIDALLKKFSEIPIGVETDVFGKIYEFFLGEFAIGEGQKGGEFYTPPAVVRLMVEVMEPTNGTLKLLDPACGSGGMFVQTANFLRKNHPDLLQRLTVYGYEKKRETARLAKMNCKINGLRAFIHSTNTFETMDEFAGEYDYVLANPPFNVKEVKAETVDQKRHFNQFGLPKNKGKNKGEDLIPNANYLWISLFASALKTGGKAGLVMANSASDASGSELDIRKRLLENGLIRSMLTLSSNMFNTVTLPATLWFFEKKAPEHQTDDPTVLFVDARNIFTQISRKQRTFSEEQVQNIALIFRLQRGESERFYAQVAAYQQKAAELDRAASTFYEQHLRGFEGSTKSNSDDRRQQKEIERLQNEHLALEKQRDYYLQHRDWLMERFPDGQYRDVTGLCKLASLADIAEQNYSLNPGRYVGVVIEHDGLTAEEFAEEMRTAHEELARLNAEAHTLEAQIAAHVQQIFAPSKSTAL
jgi:type I restriction enzyme M protein